MPKKDIDADEIVVGNNCNRASLISEEDRIK